MSRLQIIACPSCKRPMTESEDSEIRRAESFKDCVRRCEACRVGASNADGSPVTFIYNK
jgi:uncharacterized protein YbaR (Trm112 family)